MSQRRISDFVFGITVGVFLAVASFAVGWFARGLVP